MRFKTKLHAFSIQYQFKGGGPMYFKSWRGMTFNIATKYRWYFEYRAALFKVQNPRASVWCNWGPYDPVRPKEGVILLKHNVTVKQRNYTRFKNKLEAELERVKKVNDKLLIPHDWESDPKYHDFKLKLERLESELTQAKEELKNKI